MSHEPDPAHAAGMAAAQAFDLFSVQRLRDAVSATPADHPGRAGRLSNLGVALLALFERTGDTAALAEAIQAGRQAVTAIPADHPRLAGRLTNLGNALQALFERTGDTAALAEAIQAGRQAVTAIPADHPDRAVILNNFGNAVRLSSRVTDDNAALAEAIQVGRQAVATAPADHPDRTAFLNNLGLALRLMSERTGDATLATEAVQAAHLAASAAPADHPDRAAILDNLALSLQGVFRWTSDTNALTEAVQAGRAAVAATPPDHPDLAGRTSSLGRALLKQFHKTGDITLLAESVQMARDALTVMPPDHPKRADLLNELASALQELFLRSGDTAVLAEAIQASRDAAAAIPEGNPDHAAILGNLANSLRALFERSGDTAVLREAVALARGATTIITGHSAAQRASRMGHLASILLTLCVRTEDAGALAEALAAAREAVAAAAPGHSDRGAMLDLLSLALRMTAGRTGDASALAEAARAGREAVAAIPEGHAGRASALSNLGIGLLALFRWNDDITTLMEAVEAGREAVAATPADDPNLGIRLENLGIALRTAAQRTGSEETLIEALGAFRKAGGLGDAPPRARIAALADAAVIADGLGADPAAAMELMEEAVRLLPRLAPRTLARADREHELGYISLLSEAGSLAGVAAAAAVTAGRPARAVELLEQARGVLMADTVNARSSDLTRLRETAPVLAAAFDELRARIDAVDPPDVAQPGADAAASGQDDGTGVVRLALGRRDTQAAWDGLLARIREQDAFSDFLLPPRIEHFAAQAREGPIVFLTTSPARSYALIVTDHPADPVRALPLTGLSAGDIVTRLDKFVAARAIALDPPDGNPWRRLAGQATVFNTFQWLWDAITGPVLDALGYTSTPDGEADWPRLWWCPTGFLTQLPIHAAGHHADLFAGDPQQRANPRAVLDRVVSSYTTTLRGLGYARTHQPVPGASPALIVAVPDAPRATPLPGVDIEADALITLIPGARQLPHPARDTVLQALPSHRVAHFACHAVSDWTDPAASRLILHDHLVRPLTVADISDLRLDGGLAFLSACDTATSGPTLSDEAMHLTGAFHLAGYRHVIGTLWPVNDHIAHGLVKDFYTQLTADGTAPPDVDSSAVALHRATPARRLRKRYLTSPAHWAAYIHTGA